MRRFIPLALVAAITCVAPAHAGKKGDIPNIDFGAYSCEQFMGEMAKSSSDDMGAVLLWLDGYLSGVSGDAVLNWKNLERFTTALMEYCARNQDAGLLEAAQKVGIE